MLLINQLISNIKCQILILNTGFKKLILFTKTLVINILDQNKIIRISV